MTLRLDHLSVTRQNGRETLRDVSLAVGAGEFVGLIGPNGAGKTTLLRAAQGLLPATGSSSLTALTPGQRAREAAFLPQSREIAWDLTVETLVTLGRTPHLPSRADRDATARAIAQMQLTELARRRATRLSGGEQARALIARALAQETPLLLADEPIAGLDPAAQIATMQLFARLATEGRAVIAALHDLSLAARHCTRLVVLHQGRIAADGPPEEVLTRALLAEVFHITGSFVFTDHGPLFQPTGLT
ncbi:ABC transporter ATP-binding protein [Vannielia litorea]|uniref:Iron complex transport system ATP-binding protein n=1 Tax=Vannielia litorea TaxID=1217970 RepID=A0A1N6ICE7_9RHOB|nr:ABC transporter ATP-binding protein [Vannielia litorea]SIO29659.1 iron complex transport system ATP-binding protein [Vannielia litorea]